jgi:hypothetical protein
VQSVGGTPFESAIVYFTDMPWARGHKYLLVFVCTLSGWVDAFPTQTEKAWEVAKFLIKEIIPQFRIPVFTGSDNGLAFVAEVVQSVAKGLRITWKLHTAYHPHRSGESRTYEQDSKITIGKTMPETHLQ